MRCWCFAHGLELSQGSVYVFVSGCYAWTKVCPHSCVILSKIIWDPVYSWPASLPGCWCRAWFAIWFQGEGSLPLRDLCPIQIGDQGSKLFRRNCFHYEPIAAQMRSIRLERKIWKGLVTTKLTLRGQIKLINAEKVWRYWAPSMGKPS